MCERKRPRYAKAVAFGSYEGTLRGLIHLLKFEQVRPAADSLGGMLAETIRKLQPSFGAEVVVIPVPLHKRKLRQRGFNQAELIARAALKHLDKSQLKLRTALLIRKRETESQVGLTDHQRRENLRGAFLVDRPELIVNREALLVDDVFTTGTTAAECAAVLGRAGASKVWVATVARTVKYADQTPTRVLRDLVDSDSMGLAS